MNSDIVIIDNIVEEHIQNNIEQLFHSQSLPWYYYPGTVNSQTSNYFDSPQFVHILAEDGKQYSNNLIDLLPLISAIPYDVSSIMRIKCNFKQPRYDLKNCSPPHVDSNNLNFITGVYYVNDSDGDTILYSQLNDNINYPETFTEINRVTPKKGRMILFDGRRYHSSSSPIKHSTRVVLNFNFTTH